MAQYKLVKTVSNILSDMFASSRNTGIINSIFFDSSVPGHASALVASQATVSLKSPFSDAR